MPVRDSSVSVCFHWSPRADPSCFVDSSLYFCDHFTTYLFKLGVISDRKQCVCMPMYPLSESHCYCTSDNLYVLML